MQEGKGASLGASFGGGGSSLFGAGGADNILTKLTTFAALFFMATSIALALVRQDQALTSGGPLSDLLPSQIELDKATADVAEKSLVNEDTANAESKKSAEPQESNSESAIKESLPTPVNTKEVSAATGSETGDTPAEQKAAEPSGTVE